jgi:predicted metal-binding membrane protein
MIAMESRWTATPPVVLAATLGLAGTCWAISAWLMDGMDTGVATRPGAFGFFAATWVTMMAAMMLPGAAPSVARHTQFAGTMSAALPFAGGYLAIWALTGVVAYPLDRPHGTLAAGLIVIAAGVYELTPVKRQFRRHCREVTRSGLGFGLCCLGSTAGLMAMLVALDVMSLLWMAVITVIACAQKLLPAKVAIDVPLALAIIALGFVIVFSPALIPGLTRPTMPMPMSPAM